MTTKSYHELIRDRIYIGGADNVSEMMANENVDLIVDLRVESPQVVSSVNRFHSPIIDDEENQDESIRAAIEYVMKAYNDGKKVYFHCQGGSNRTGTVAIGILLATEKQQLLKKQKIWPKLLAQRLM